MGGFGEEDEHFNAEIKVCVEKNGSGFYSQMFKLITTARLWVVIEETWHVQLR